MAYNRLSRSEFRRALRRHEMPETNLEPKEYCRRSGIPYSTVARHLKNEQPLPGVVGVQKYSRFYLLTVDLDKLQRWKDVRKENRL